MSAHVRPGVLVDLDGTLVDTNYLHTLAWAHALDDAGEWAPMSAIHRLIGMGGDQLLLELLGHDCPAAVEARPGHYRTLMSRARAFPGAREALEEWHEGGLVVVIASSSPRDELDPMLALLGADGSIDAITSADDVDQSKPHPEVFEVALRAGGIDRRRAVVIGDSVWDIHAAAAARLPALAVETGGIAAGDLRAAGAARVYADVGALRPHVSLTTVDRLAR